MSVELKRYLYFENRKNTELKLEIFSSIYINFLLEKLINDHRSCLSKWVGKIGILREEQGIRCKTYSGDGFKQGVHYS